MSDARRRTCQLYLVVETDNAALERLAAIFAAGPVASVLFRPTAGTALTARSVKALVDLAQKHDTAALLLDDAALARTLRADGVHLSASADVMARYDEARSVLGGGAIVGCDAGGSRHIAMELGEAGAEYVAFGCDVSLVGAVDDSDVDGEVPAPVEHFDQRALIAWWSDVFEVPCVAVDLADADAVRVMASAGADFVAVQVPTSDAAAWVASMRRALEAVDA